MSETPPAVLGGTVLASEERLTHFRCVTCEGWWSIGDFEASRDLRTEPMTCIYCPWCGDALALPDPLPLLE